MNRKVREQMANQNQLGLELDGTLPRIRNWKSTRLTKSSNPSCNDVSCYSPPAGGYNYQNNNNTNRSIYNEVSVIHKAKVNSFLEQFETLSKEEQVQIFEKLLYQLPYFQHRDFQIILDDVMKYDLIGMFLAKGLNHIAEQIFSHLDDESLKAAEQVNEQYRSVISSGMLWKKLIERQVTNDILWRMICDKRGWMEHLFKPKLEVPFKEGPFYKKLYYNLRARYQNLESNWRDGRNSNSTFKIYPCRSHLYGGANCIQFDDNILVSGFNESTAKIYSTQTLTHLKTLQGHSGPVLCLQFDSSVIMTGSKDATVKVWNIATGDLQLTLKKHTDAIFGLRFDDNWLITCSMDQKIVIWERLTSKNINPIRSLIGEFGYGLICVDFSQKYIVAGSEDATIKTWNMNSWTPHRSLFGHEAEVECIQIRGRYVVSGSFDMSVRVWDVVFGLCLKVLDEHEAVVGTLRFDDKYIVSGSEGRIVVWDFPAVLNPEAPERSLCLQHIMDQEGFICGLHFDNFKIVSGSKDDTIMVYEFINLNDPKEEFQNETM